MRKEQQMVRDFHAAFDHPIASGPQMLTDDRVQRRAEWMAEEVREFCAAQTVDEQADAMVDLMYFALGTLVEMGVDGMSLFHIVHQANMAKLWPDGKPRFRDGVAINNLFCKLGKGAHHVNDINNLKHALLTLFYWFLSSDHHHGHCA